MIEVGKINPIGWKPFGAMGQAPASVMPASDAPTDTQEKACALPRIAESLALVAAGGLLVYLVMTFTGPTEGHGGYPR
jgi:hypothetical protein